MIIEHITILSSLNKYLGEKLGRRASIDEENTHEKREASTFFLDLFTLFAGITTKTLSTLFTTMEEKKPSSEHALYTSVVVKNQKMNDPDRQLRISRIKRQIAVLKLEMNSIRQTIERGTGGGLFARLDGRLGAEEQLIKYTTRMETLKQELDILNTPGLQETPVYNAVSTLNKTQTVTSRRNPRADEEPKSASGRKVKQMEMAVDFLMADEAYEDNTMDLQGEFEADIYTSTPQPWFEMFLVRQTMCFRRKCVQLGLAWGSIQSRHTPVQEHKNNKRVVIIKNVLLLCIVAIVVVVIQLTRNFSFRRARHQTISDRILASGISFPIDIETKNSPQYMALDWITASDPGNLDDDDKFLLQRYALAVFWFSTMDTSMYNVTDVSVAGIRGSNQNSWRHSDDWMSEKGICMWFGVQCHHLPGTDVYSTRYDANNNPTVINITDNRLHGSLPRELFLGLPDVRWFSLRDNELVGTVPTELGTMTKLDYLSLANNQFSGEFAVLPWKQLKLLQRLELQKNGFAGTLPTDIQELTRLTVLSLYSNKLTGPINGDLTKLRGLSALYLDKNGFTGTLPSGLYGMSAITDLRLGNNQLKGKITPFLDSTTMSNLRFLQLERNLFTGSLPSKLSLLTKLVELRVHGNQMDGTIPTQIGRMHDLGKDMTLESIGWRIGFFVTISNTTLSPSMIHRKPPVG